ncbi:hypothetical protein AVEN_172046-1 [Araneus ventricosus]|uniref:Uncharacterized protein n=1 Tax=Araneus ventricosus TaxID=182803 RepID=A0A4Y2U165_ARAVE|nr:hypothetical protein AVEN_172046-1 [Araneus ventricosus]
MYRKNGRKGSWLRSGSFLCHLSEHPAYYSRFQGLFASVLFPRPGDEASRFAEYNGCDSAYCQRGPRFPASCLIGHVTRNFWRVALPKFTRTQRCPSDVAFTVGHSGGPWRERASVFVFLADCGLVWPCCLADFSAVSCVVSLEWDSDLINTVLVKTEI